MSERLFPEYKCVLIGESGVGKTSILMRYARGTFDENNAGTIGIECMVKNEVRYWDTAGQERFHSIARHYYRNMDLCMLVFDVTNITTLWAIRDRWLPDMKKELGDERFNALSFILVGNKSETEAGTEDCLNDADLLLGDNDNIVECVVTSAKSGKNIDRLFEAAVSHMPQKGDDWPDFRPPDEPSGCSC